MKIGKLTNEQLQELVIDKLKVGRREVVLGAGIGEDCAVLDFADNLCVISTDPITGASEDAGSLAVHISANDVSAAGGEPVAMLVTMLIPPSATMEQLERVTDELCTQARRLNIDIVGGHTEITDAVNRIVLSTVVLGKAGRVLRGKNIRPGDCLVMTKQAGMEGAMILCADFPEKVAEILDAKDRALLEQMGEQISVVTEAKIGEKLGASAMHDVTEGGILGASYELADAAGLGLRLEVKNIAVHPVAQKVCAHLGLNPYRLISSGSLLIVQPGDPAPLLQALEQAGIAAKVIGVFMQEKGITDENGTPILPPQQDELYKITSGQGLGN